MKKRKKKVFDQKKEVRALARERVGDGQIVAGLGSKDRTQEAQAQSSASRT